MTTPDSTRQNLVVTSSEAEPGNQVRNSFLGPLAVGLLLAANAVVPVVCGDIYPFTSGPMFRDAPSQYADYRVVDPDGIRLPSKHYALERHKSGDPMLVGRVYDGNPVGYGVGIAPPPVLEQEFGVVHDEETVRRHIQNQLARQENAGLEYVVVEQDVIGAIDGQRVGIVETQKWRIERAQALSDQPPRHQGTE